MIDNEYVYLDYNATAPLHPQVLEVMTDILSRPHNASSVHALGREGRNIIECARKTVAAAVSVFPGEVIFTASGTEANNMALRGFPRHKIMVSAVEHASVLNVVRNAEIIPVTSDGLVDMETLERMLLTHARQGGNTEGDGAPLVSVQFANNETGVIQPIEDIAGLVHKYGGLLHCDAAQALGKIPVDFGRIGADMLTLSAHKFGGAQGAGALIVRDKLPIEPFIAGGGQELRRRAGTENVAAIAGFAKAVEIVSDMSYLRQWLNSMESALKTASHETFIVGSSVPRLPNTSCIATPGVNSETQLMHFDLEGFAVSAGSACSSGRVEESHVLKAMGVASEVSSCAIRVSLGWNTQKSETEAFVASWKRLCDRVIHRACGSKA